MKKKKTAGKDAKTGQLVVLRFKDLGFQTAQMLEKIIYISDFNIFSYPIYSFTLFVVAAERA